LRPVRTFVVAIAPIFRFSGSTKNTRLLRSGCVSLLIKQATVALIAYLANTASTDAAVPGSVDPSFNPHGGAVHVYNGRGWRVVLQGDGKIILGGDFEAYNFTPVAPVVRLNPNGSLDTSFDASVIKLISGDFESHAYPFAINNSQIIVGGRFELAGGERRNLIRLNASGKRDMTFNPQFGSTSTTLPPQIVEAIVQPDGKILVSGSFDSVNGVPNKFLARLNADGSTDTSFASTIGGRAGAFALQNDGKIVAASGNTVVRLNADSSRDPSFVFQEPPPGTYKSVSTVLIQPDGKIIVSGLYSLFQAAYTERLTSDGQLDQSYPFLEGSAIALDSKGRLLFSAGGFGYNLERRKLDGSRDPTFTEQSTLEGALDIVEQLDGRLVIAGDFFPSPGAVGRLMPDGGTDETFDVGIGLTSIGAVEISATLLPSGKIVVYGDFNYFDQVPRDRLAVLNGDGTVDEGFDAGDLLSADFRNYDVRTVVGQPDGEILVVAYGYGQNLVRLDSSGRIDGAFKYSSGDQLQIAAIAVDNRSRILLATQKGLIRLNRDGTRDRTFESALPNGAVSQVAVQPDGKIIVNHNEKLRRLNPNGSIDSGFNSNGALLLAFVGLQPDGKILYSYYSAFNFYLSRLNSDGTDDTSFEVQLKGPVTAFAADTDGFYLSDETSVRRIKYAGTVDPSFRPEFGANAVFHSLLLQIDGRLVIAGAFDRVNGIERHGIVRLIGTAPDMVANISTRVRVGPDDAAAIGGFIVSGNAPKTVVIRALGPSLPFQGQSSGRLSNPTLDVYDSSGQGIAHNDNWRNAQGEEITQSGLAPRNDLEAAVIVTLDPGAYTAVVRGRGQEEGIGIVEIYDVSPAADSRLANISTRGLVQTGENVMIGGFILQGGENTEVVTRALGPSGTLIASNNDWRDTQESAIIASELAPADDREAALLTTLPPGAYTAIVRGGSDDVGIGLVEIYDLR